LSPCQPEQPGSPDRSFYLFERRWPETAFLGAEIVFTEAKDTRHERNPARGFHWKTFHEGIQAYVHSYYLNVTDPPVLIDPRVPAQGIEWFTAHGAPQHIYLTNRHHYRHSDRFSPPAMAHRSGATRMDCTNLSMAKRSGDSATASCSPAGCWL